MKKLLSIMLITTCAFATVRAEVETQGQKPVPCGESVTIQATPNNQYFDFVGWTDQDGSSTANLGNENPYTYTPTADVTITALFKQKEFTVTYALNPDAADNKGVTLTTNKPNTVNAPAGDYYPIDPSQFETGTGNCLSITGYKVTMYELLADGSTATTPTTIEITDLNDPENYKFQLKGNATIMPIVTQGSYVVTIKSDTSMGRVSFVTNPNNGSSGNNQ